ncbi:OmpA family protein [Pedobacter sp. Leaf170]|uniref:OmpA family protein n=1 Tax=Pedobacter sp. Leaf170 TaxID=2876558 RepID=UPI001E41F773|nr:OmpA family protein [Pedobacter sp. Leaf170]
MKKSLQTIFILIALLINLSAVKAQYVLKEADKAFDLFNYNKAINLYEQAYKKKQTLHAAERLAQSYQFINNYPQAESWYAIASKMPGSKNENILNYAKTLQQNAKYSEAKTQYLSFFEKDTILSSNDKSKLIASCDSAVKWMKNPSKTQVNNLNTINGPQSDWGSTLYQNALVFTSDRKTSAETDKNKPFLKFDGSKLPDKKIYGWTGNGYLKLYTKQGNDSVKTFSVNAVTNYHIGAASFTADGKTVYFTLTRIPENLNKIKEKTRTINVEIFSNTKNSDGTWGAAIPFKYNDVKAYSVGDPFILGNGNKLYFLSDMHGGLGGTDIYVVEKLSSGAWGEAKNLGELNSQGNERTPYLDNNNVFYFSSDGQVGMGGLDIFRVSKSLSGTSMVTNLGYPTNSPQDDFAFNMDDKTNKAYLSSNRFGGLGNDDIYSLNTNLNYAIKLNGKVFDKKTNQVISKAVVTLTKINSTPIKVESDNDGNFKFNLEQNSDYELTGVKTNYRSGFAQLTTKALSADSVLTKNLYLETVELDKPIKIENIFYDFDKWSIRADAAVELDKLVKVMLENPTIWIEFGSHTDSRGKDAYNLILSQKRADAAVKYIVSKGIDVNRISAKGYGESKLLNNCKNGIQCDEQAQQANRRTEFKIVKQ